MVFVPWEEYGICKWHMLKRCYAGEKCVWEHPPEKECKRLWDQHTAKQQEDWSRYGIPHLKNPYKNAGNKGGVGEEEARERVRERLDSRSPGSGWRSPEVSKGEMVGVKEMKRKLGDLAIAPKEGVAPVQEGRKVAKPKNANRMPLGKPNRLGAGDVPSPAAMSIWRRPGGSGDLEMAESGGEESAPILQRDDELEEGEISVEEGKRDDDIEMGEMPPPPVPSFCGADSRNPSNSTSTSSTLLLLPRYGTPFTATMGATKRMSNGEPKPIGPHPSTIRVSAQYSSQAAIEKRLQPSANNGELDMQERSVAEAREDSMRLQGVTWIDNVRRALSLPIRTYATACIYYHKFRLANPGILHNMEYGNAMADACAAALLTACKVEDTLKKSKDILAAAYNIKAPGHDQVGSDDPIFEGPSRAVIGLERMVLEAGGFDFRSKNPHKLFYKIAHTMPQGEDDERSKVEKIGWTMMTDMFRTFAPLKQTVQTMALAGLELAAHLVAASTPSNTSAIRDALGPADLQKWSTTREEVMETLLDMLDLYTQHTAHTILGTQHSLDDFLRIRLAFNKECNENSIPRYTIASPADRSAANGSTLQVANGHPTPVSPPHADAQTQAQQAQNNYPPIPEAGGTLRFTLNPSLVAEEKAEVQRYFVEEWEEYEEEIEVPIPREAAEGRRGSNGRPGLDGVRGEDRDTMRDRDRLARLRDQQEREVERERERLRARERERDRRYDDRRYDDRRFDDRRDRRYDERRFDDGRRRGR